MSTKLLFTCFGKIYCTDKFLFEQGQAVAMAIQEGYIPLASIPSGKSQKKKDRLKVRILVMDYEHLDQIPLKTDPFDWVYGYDSQDGCHFELAEWRFYYPQIFIKKKFPENLSLQSPETNEELWVRDLPHQYIQ
ncbi:hypothetical protein GF362_04875 [Candidatus Dojkabacteria bacterium]|nr:hypothetical protein [Candidatus Dojkabacteria bacterium]